MKSFSYLSAPDMGTALRAIADHEDVRFLAGGTWFGFHHVRSANSG